VIAVTQPQYRTDDGFRAFVDEVLKRSGKVARVEVFGDTQARRMGAHSVAAVPVIRIIVSVPVRPSEDAGDPFATETIMWEVIKESTSARQEHEEVDRVIKALESYGIVANTAAVPY
jgi:hypothetical protein